MSISSFLFSKRTLSKEFIEINNITFHCEDIGLCTFSKNHDFEYNHVSLTNKVSWEYFLYETFDLTLLTLISKKEIIIEVVNYEEAYLSSFYKYKKRKFLIQKGIESENNDFFSKSIINALNRLLKRKQNEIYLHELITEVFNEFLGEFDRYLKPEKEMLLKILNLYICNNDWLKFEEDYHMLGTVFKYKVNIEPIYIPRLKMQYENIKEFQKTVLKRNAPYMQLKRRINEALEFNTLIRYSLYSGNDNRYYDGIHFSIPTNY